VIKDERISGDRNRIAARGYLIWYVMLLAALLYRQFYLHQALSEYWDLALTFFVGTFYVTIAMFARGAVIESSLARSFKWMIVTIVITNVALAYFQGQISSAGELVTSLLSALLGVSVVGGGLYYLYRRWERRAQVED
jgi:hypothetical protein